MTHVINNSNNISDIISQYVFALECIKSSVRTIKKMQKVQKKTFNKPLIIIPDNCIYGNIKVCLIKDDIIICIDSIQYKLLEYNDLEMGFNNNDIKNHFENNEHILEKDIKL